MGAVSGVVKSHPAIEHSGRKLLNPGTQYIHIMVECLSEPFTLFIIILEARILLHCENGCEARQSPLAEFGARRQFCNGV